MRTLNRIILQFALLFAAGGSLFAQGYKIEVTIKGNENGTAILGHYFNTNMYPDDTIKLDSKGYGVFKKPTAMPDGMYIIFMPPGKVFEFMLSSAGQTFALKTDTADLAGKLEFTGSEENTIFSGFQKFRINKGEEINSLKDQLGKATSDAEKTTLTNRINKLSEEINTESVRIINTYSNLFFGKFLKATREIDVPDSPKDETGKEIDPNFKYNYYRAHYFDNFEVGNAGLLRTPIYENKINTYITKLVPQVPDSLIKAADWLIAKTVHNEELFRYMLASLYNRYNTSNIMGMDAVLVFLIEKYYLSGKATWLTEKSKKEMEELVLLKKPNLIGKVIRDFTFQRVDDDAFVNSISHPEIIATTFGKDFKLNQIKSKYTLLIFWEADCSHCKVALPDLGSRYARMKSKGCEVMAIHMLSGDPGRQKWFEFINKNQLLGWINVWSPYSADYKVIYDIKSSPVVYLLDEKKAILAKRIGVDQAEGLLYEREFRDLIQGKTEVSQEELLVIAKKYVDAITEMPAMELVQEFLLNYFDATNKPELERYIKAIITKNKWEPSKKETH